MAQTNIYVRDMIEEEVSTMLFDTRNPNMKAKGNKARVYEESPTSVASYLSPPTMMKLPETFVPELAMPEPVQDQGLPATSTWGLRHKVELRRRNRFAKLEAIDAQYTSEQLHNKWRLPNKSPNPLEKKMKSLEKTKERALLKKHYIKQRAIKSEARESHELFVAKAQANAKRKTPWRGPTLASEPTIEDEKMRTRVAKKPYKKPKGHLVMHEKIRRNLRRDARDRKCFAPHDRHEVEAIGLAAKLFKRSKKLNPFTTPRFLKMLKSESKGVPLSDIYGGGVFLSCAAADDLKTMMAASRQASLDMPVVIQRATVQARARYYLHSGGKMSPKASGRGSTSYMRHPSMVKAQGKRRS